MFVLTLFRIIKLITDANEFLSFTGEFIKWTRIGALKSTQVRHTHVRMGDVKNGGMKQMVIKRYETGAACSGQGEWRVPGWWHRGALEKRVFWQVHVWSDVILFILPTQLLLWSSFFPFWWGAKMLHQRLMLELRMKEREVGGRVCACGQTRTRTCARVHRHTHTHTEI